MILPCPLRFVIARYLWFVGFFLVWWSYISYAPAEPPRFHEDGFLLIQGRPRLILGCYELPKAEETLKQLAENGFNLVRVSNRAELDRVGKHGMFGWQCLNVALDENDPAGRKRIAGIVNQSKDHPSLLVWELPDEALWNVWYRRLPWATHERFAALRKQIATAKNSREEEQKQLALVHRAEDRARRGLWTESDAICDQLWKQLGVPDPRPDAKLSLCPAKATALAERMTRGCVYLRELDPNHVIWQNHAPRNALTSLQRFNAAVDAAGCDIYPVPLGSTGHSDLTNRMLSSVGAYTERMARGAPGKAVWMVLQGFGWRDLHKESKNHPDPNHGRRPRWQETRFMAYDSLLHGAGAILYWGTSYIEGVYGNPKNPANPYFSRLFLIFCESSKPVKTGVYRGVRVS